MPLSLIQLTLLFIIVLEYHLFFSGILNLDYFLFFMPPLCMSENIGTVHAVALKYVPALYPLFLYSLYYILSHSNV